MTDYTCIHEEQIQGQSRKIESLETRAGYKERDINELKQDMKDIKKDIKDLKDDINEFLLTSVKDDNDLKNILNNFDNRLIALETRQDTQEKDFKTWLAVIGAVFIILTFYFNFLR